MGRSSKQVLTSTRCCGSIFAELAACSSILPWNAWINLTVSRVRRKTCEYSSQWPRTETFKIGSSYRSARPRYDSCTGCLKPPIWLSTVGSPSLCVHCETGINISEIHAVRETYNLNYFLVFPTLEQPNFHLGSNKPRVEITWCWTLT
jgi:hypothetical protein